jgi:hypothetical protein
VSNSDILWLPSVPNPNTLESAAEIRADRNHPERVAIREKVETPSGEFTELLSPFGREATASWRDRQRFLNAIIKINEDSAELESVLEVGERDLIQASAVLTRLKESFTALFGQ